MSIDWAIAQEADNLSRLLGHSPGSANALGLQAKIEDAMRRVLDAAKAMGDASNRKDEVSAGTTAQPQPGQSFTTSPTNQQPVDKPVTIPLKEYEQLLASRNAFDSSKSTAFMAGLAAGRPNDYAKLEAKNVELDDLLYAFRMALEHIREIWAGSECGEPKYAQEAYAINLCKEMYQEAVDALAGRATERESSWQPIETAPEDGTTILVYGLPESKETVTYKKPAVYTAAWDEIDRRFCLSGGDWTGPFVEPTHWMPRPDAPDNRRRGSDE